MASPLSMNYRVFSVRRVTEEFIYIYISSFRVPIVGKSLHGGDGNLSIHPHPCVQRIREDIHFTTTKYRVVAHEKNTQMIII